MKTLRQFVIEYLLPTGNMTEKQWDDAFKAFCAAVMAFKSASVGKLV
jgi:hypothetical protein